MHPKPSYFPFAKRLPWFLVIAIFTFLAVIICCTVKLIFHMALLTSLPIVFPVDSESDVTLLSMLLFALQLYGAFAMLIYGVRNAMDPVDSDKTESSQDNIE